MFRTSAAPGPVGDPCRPRFPRLQWAAGLLLTSLMTGLTGSVAAAAHPPEGADNSLTILEDSPYTFTAADFEFRDLLDDPPNAFIAVHFPTIPTAGALMVDGRPAVAGERVDLIPVHGVWPPREQLRHWSQVVMSADGARMAAAVSFGKLYTSGDAGATWMAREEIRNWSSIASSADGSKLVATVSNGQIFTSTDAGATWTPRESSRDWRRVASSADGSTLAALENDGKIHLSYDSGLNWQARALDRPWHGILMSADGSKMVATTAFQEPVFISEDGGVTWTSAGPHRFWRASLAGSADGSRLLAIADFELLASTDSGLTWTPLPHAPPLVPGAGLASSADGSIFALATVDGLYTSLDGGERWTRRAYSDGGWVDVASSADGTALVALKGTVHGPGQIHTSNASVPALVFTPAPDAFGPSHATLTFQVVDDGESGGSIDPIPRTLTINVTPQRDGPAAGMPPPDQLAIDGIPFSHQLAEDTFVHPDPGAVVTYAARQINGEPLPAWLHFSPATRTFAGTPTDADKGLIEILLEATDDGLPPLSATTRLQITVPNEAPVGTDFQATLPEDFSLVITASDFGFSDPHDSPPNRFSRVLLTSLPTAGTLTIDGVPVEVGEKVSVIPDLLSSWQGQASDQAWSAIASSADGTKLAATVTDGQIFSSLDSGITWTARATERKWNTIASSADGTRLIAAAANDFVYVSSDSGETWSPRHSAREWRAVASSADGTRLVAAEFPGWLWVSSDAGTTWSDRGDFRRWKGVASSSDGRHLFAVEDDGLIYVSADFGLTWYQRAQREAWTRIRCSTDGRRAVALGTHGRIYGSSDFGSTWAPLRADTQWADVALSADGMTVCAVQNPGRIAHSVDGGGTWALRETSRPWTGVACSSDGKSVAATVHQGPVFTSLTGVPQLVFTPAPNGAGSPYTGFSFQVEDDGLGGVTLDSTPNHFIINVQPINDPPMVARVLSGQLATERAPFSHIIPANTFSDPDVSDVLTLSARTATGGPLPAWLSFNTLTRTLSGTPGSSDVGFLDVHLTATDNADPPLSSSTSFLLRVANVDEAPTGTPSILTLEANASRHFTAADFGFADPHDTPAHHFGRVKIATVPSAGMLTLDGSPVTPGQFAVVQPIPSGATWTARTQARNWMGLASSADGQRLVAAEFTGGRLHTSDDAGATWIPRGSNSQWIAVASSSDGQRLLAAEIGGHLFTSINAGVTWSPRHTPANWIAVASSTDGLKLAAAQSGGPLVISSDGGASWITVGPAREYRDIALSADGSRLITAVENDQLFTSSDGGHSWSARATRRGWQTVASSADGMRLFAGAHAGGLHASADGGVTWRQCEISRTWSALAASSDGTKLVAADHGGLLYTSTDAGLNWRPRASRNLWKAVAISADGSRLAAAGSEAPIFTSSEVPAQSLVFTPAPNSTGTPYATLTFQVEDDGAANANLDGTPRLLNLNVAPASPSPFANWALANGLPTDPMVSNGADLLVFACGLPPGTAPSGVLALVDGQIMHRGLPKLLAANPPEDPSWRLLFGRRKASGLTYRVQATFDLDSWEEIPIPPTVLADDGIIEACQVVLPAALSDGRPPRFARLSVTTD